MPFLAQEQLDFPTKDLLSWYFDDPQYDQDKPIYIDAADPKTFYTAKQARTTICQVIAGLRTAGLQQGDCVNLHAFNNVHYPLLVNGIVGAGGIFSGTNPGYQPYELAHAAKTARIRYFIAEPALLPHVLSAATEAGIPHANVFAFDNANDDAAVPEGIRSWRWLLQHGEADWVRFDDLETARNTTAARLYSSGTTGAPKAAVLTHYNFMAQHLIINEWQKKPYDMRRLLATPFFHMGIAPAAHFSPLRNGAPTYIMRRFELEPFLSYIQRYSITEGAFFPPLVIAILMSPATKKYSLRSIRHANCGAAPLDKDLQVRLRALFREDAPFTQVWGMTELTCVATMLPYPERDDTGSVGRFVPGLDAKLVDDEGNDVTGYDVRGELCVRGPTVINGYFDNPEANARDWDADGYFHTGDVAYCDGKSKLWYIVDRKKELIKVRAFQVAPPELEAVLLSHPQIIDAAVIGVPAPNDDGELPRAYIVRRSGPAGAALMEAEVKEYLGARLARFKRLEGGVVFVGEVPRNPSGKILKRVLREQAKGEMEKERGAGSAKL